MAGELGEDEGHPAEDLVVFKQPEYTSFVGTREEQAGFAAVILKSQQESPIPWSVQLPHALPEPTGVLQANLQAQEQLHSSFAAPGGQLKAFLRARCQWRWPSALRVQLPCRR
jgi:hypothetical protein